MSNKVFCLELNEYQVQDDVSKYKITGETKKMGTLRCAVLKRDGDNSTYLKPWEQINNYHVPGEKNLGAKLKTAQVMQIVKTAYTTSRDDVTFASLAKDYGVSAKQISNIVHGNAWRHVTRKLIYQLVHHNKNTADSCVSASNDMRHKVNKLSPSLAKFVVRDHLLNKISIKKLAEKYLMDESSIRRVVSGKAWKATTIPAIAEYNNWK